MLNIAIDITMNKPLNILRKNINALLQKAGWNQAQLAERLKWDPSHVSAYLNTREPRIDKIEELAAIFGVTISDLFKSDELPELRVFIDRDSPTIKALAQVIKDQEETIQHLRKELEAKSPDPSTAEFLDLWNKLNKSQRPNALDYLRTMVTGIVHSDIARAERAEHDRRLSKERKSKA